MPAIATTPAAIAKNMKAGSIQMSDALMAQIHETWKGRAKAQGMKGAKLRIAEVEFYVGAMYALATQGFIPPPIWVINIATGRSPSDK